MNYDEMSAAHLQFDLIYNSLAATMSALSHSRATSLLKPACEHQTNSRVGGTELFAVKRQAGCVGACDGGSILRLAGAVSKAPRVAAASLQRQQRAPHTAVVWRRKSCWAPSGV